VLHVDALDHADPIGELEQLRLGEGLGGVEAALLLPDQRRVQAFLDRRPDGEGRCEVVALDDEVGAVAHGDLVDLGEEVVGRVAGEDVGEPRLDADAGQSEQPAFAPALVLVELLLSQQDVRVGQGHRHVEVGASVFEGGVEDRRVEARVGRVEDGLRLGLAKEGDERLSIARVDLGRGEALVSVALHDGSWTCRIQVGERHALEEVPSLRNRRHRGAHRPRSDHEHLHLGRDSSTVVYRSGNRSRSESD